MAPTYEKYDGVVGGFRATLAAAVTVDSAGCSGLKAVSLDANGRVVIGTAGQSGLAGLMIKNVPVTQVTPNAAAVVLNNIWVGVRAGDAVDVMTSGEIVDTGFPAGTKVYAHADGTVDTVATAGTLVGHTVEAGRLIVRVAHAI